MPSNDVQKVLVFGDNYDTILEPWREDHSIFYSYLHAGGSPNRYGHWLNACFIYESTNRQVEIAKINTEIPSS